jgi:hypothetical protein
MEPGAARVGMLDIPAFTIPPAGIAGPVWPDTEDDKENEALAPACHRSQQEILRE